MPIRNEEPSLLHTYRIWIAAQNKRNYPFTDPVKMESDSQTNNIRKENKTKAGTATCTVTQNRRPYRSDVSRGASGLHVNLNRKWGTHFGEIMENDLNPPNIEGGTCLRFIPSPLAYHQKDAKTVEECGQADERTNVGEKKRQPVDEHNDSSD